MSDSVDRVFVHALQTVRRLPRTGSSRPPPSSRLRLYGLYKQSMEGDVSTILPRPTLPPSSPDPGSQNVHRYASKDLRARETQAEIEKWDAWNECAGMSRTEAKRRYISTLIDTMKVYASGTQESRELIGELEFVWGQIRSQSGSSEEEGEAESPTRKLERAGLRPTESYGSIPPGRDSGGGVSSSALRVLSPVSQSRDEIVEGEDAAQPISDDEDGEQYRDASESPEEQTSPHTPSRQVAAGDKDDRWRRKIESALSKMTAEIAALREQIEMSQSSEWSSYRRKSWLSHKRGGMLAWMRWLVWIAVRQVVFDLVVLGLLVSWGRAKGDRGAEEWVRRRWKDVRMREILGRLRGVSFLRLF